MRPAFGLRPWLGGSKRRPRASQQGPKRSVIHLAPTPRIVNFADRNIYLLGSWAAETVQSKAQRRIAASRSMSECGNYLEFVPNSGFALLTRARPAAGGMVAAAQSAPMSASAAASHITSATLSASEART